MMFYTNLHENMIDTVYNQNTRDGPRGDMVD
jgi:hypothetical protein